MQQVGNNFSPSQLEEKQCYFRNIIRSQHIHLYKQAIRKNIASKQTLNKLIQIIPKQLQDVEHWCRTVANEFSTAYDYQIHDSYIYQLFKLIQKHPNIITIRLFYLITHKISINAIYILFQFYDIMGFIENLITKQDIEIEEDQRELVKYCYLIIAQLCTMSLKTRNFIIKHQSYDILLDTYEQYCLKTEFLTCLCALTKCQMNDHQQFNFISQKIILLYQQSQSFEDLSLIAQCLSHVARDKIHIIHEYEVEIFHITLNLIRLCRNQVSNELGSLMHSLHTFLLSYLKQNLPLNFMWNQYLDQWIYLLSVNNYALKQARKEIYDIFYIIMGHDVLHQTLITQKNFLSCLNCWLKQERSREAIHSLCSIIRLQFGNCGNFVPEVLFQLVNTVLQALLGGYIHLQKESKVIMWEGMEILLSMRFDEFIGRQILNIVNSFYDRMLGRCSENGEKQMQTFLNVFEICYQKYI